MSEATGPLRAIPCLCAHCMESGAADAVTHRRDLVERKRTQTTAGMHLPVPPLLGQLMGCLSTSSKDATELARELDSHVLQATNADDPGMAYRSVGLLFRCVPSAHGTAVLHPWV